MSSIFEHLFSFVCVLTKGSKMKNSVQRIKKRTALLVVHLMGRQLGGSFGQYGACTSMYNY